MLRLEEVTKKYPHRQKEVYALQRVTAAITPGEYVAVVGPSGSGKSTLLLMLGGMLSPTEGRVILDGHSLYELDTRSLAAYRCKKLGFIFQTFNLVPYLTALENVQIPLYLSGLAEKAQEKKATALLEKVGLGDRLDHKPSELSIGQQQRVALARMLANDPPLILADEPTGNLDPETSKGVLDFLGTLHREGKTIVMVTHDMRAAARAGRMIRLAAGSIDECRAGKPDA